MPIDSGPGLLDAKFRQAKSQADALAEAGRWSEAEPIYKALAQMSPNSAELLARLSLAQKATGAVGLAEASIRKAIALEPQEAAFHNNLGTLLRARGALDEAEQCFRRAVTRRASYLDALFNLGIVLEERKRSDEALVAYRQALAIQPDFVEGLVRVASLFIQRDDFASALSSAEKALELQPDKFEGLYFKGWALSGLSRYDEAIGILSHAVALFPERTEAKLALANTLRDSGRNDDALSQYGSVIEALPSLRHVHYEINSLAWAAGRRDLHLRSFARARELGELNPDLLLLEAQFQTRQGEHPKAEALLRSARLIAPQRRDIASLIATSLAYQRRFGESFQLFEEIVQSPEGGQYLEQFGTALFLAGEHRDALIRFQQALSLRPNDQNAWSGLSLVLRELEDNRYREIVDYSRFVQTYQLKPVGYPSLHAFNEQLTEELLALHTTQEEPIDQTMRGGSQTRGALFRRQSPAIQTLRDLVDECVADYVAKLGTIENRLPLAVSDLQEFHYSGSWSCALRSSGYHQNHIHPMGRISSAYYAHLPQSVAADHTEKRGWLKFGESFYMLGQRDRPEFFVKPQAGLLALFPSFYWHGTVPFESPDKRVTVAFDVAAGSG